MSRPPSTALTGPQQQRLQSLDRAAQALRGRHFAEAERLATDILKASRFDSDAIMILAHARIGQDRGVDAVAPLEKAARRTNDPAIETLLAALLGSIGRGADAIAQLKRTTARRPPHAPAYQELAGQFAKAGQIDDAIAAIDSGIALLPDVIALQLDAARLHLQRNDRGRAREILVKARETAPIRDVLTALARVLLLDGDYVAAADAFRHVLALNHDDAMTRADLAACLLEMGDREAGETALRLAARGKPHMLGRSVYALAMSSHGRFFFKPSALVTFLDDKAT